MTHSFAPRGDQETIEQGEVFQPKFTAEGLIPVVATEAATGQVRQELWHKGATSGEIQKVVELRTDCDQDALWLIVEQQGGGCCHVGYPSCFYRQVVSGDGELRFVLEKKADK